MSLQAQWEACADLSAHREAAAQLLASLDVTSCQQSLSTGAPADENERSDSGESGSDQTDHDGQVAKVGTSCREVASQGHTQGRAGRGSQAEGGAKAKAGREQGGSKHQDTRPDLRQCGGQQGHASAPSGATGSGASARHRPSTTATKTASAHGATSLVPPGKRGTKRKAASSKEAEVQGGRPCRHISPDPTPAVLHPVPSARSPRGSRLRHKPQSQRATSCIQTEPSAPSQPLHKSRGRGGKRVSRTRPPVQQAANPEDPPKRVRRMALFPPKTLQGSQDAVGTQPQPLLQPPSQHPDTQPPSPPSHQQADQPTSHGVATGVRPTGSAVWRPKPDDVCKLARRGFFIPQRRAQQVRCALVGAWVRRRLVQEAA